MILVITIHRINRIYYQIVYFIFYFYLLLKVTFNITVGFINNKY